MTLECAGTARRCECIITTLELIIGRNTNVAIHLAISRRTRYTMSTRRVPVLRSLGVIGILIVIPNGCNSVTSKIAPPSNEVETSAQFDARVYRKIDWDFVYDNSTLPSASVRSLLQCLTLCHKSLECYSVDYVARTGAYNASNNCFLHPLLRGEHTIPVTVMGAVSYKLKSGKFE